MGEKKKERSRQVDNKLSKQVRIDIELHRLAKIKSSKRSVSIKEYLEDLLIEDLKDETSGN